MQRKEDYFLVFFVEKRVFCRFEKSHSPLFPVARTNPCAALNTFGLRNSAATSSRHPRIATSKGVEKFRVWAGNLGIAKVRLHRRMDFKAQENGYNFQ